MGKNKIIVGEEKEQIQVEFNISMHCNACERKVAKVISKIKGVERIMTDMRNHKVVVMGRFDPDKMLKKLSKKTGKRVEILTPEGGGGGDGNGDDGNSNEDEDKATDPGLPLLMEEEGGWCDADNPVFTMFSDENANACSIM
ncbi:hypothetical protein V2J09_005620 [Rumex salicifolius]